VTLQTPANGIVADRRKLGRDVRGAALVDALGAGTLRTLLTAAEAEGIVLRWRLELSQPKERQDSSDDNY
jgi:hypothetical protein